METIQDFEDFLFLFEKQKIEYLIIGGLAFIFHAKPRYTKDIDIWINPDPENIDRANTALEEFGSPQLISLPPKRDEILQLGLPPNRIDILLSVGSLTFPDAWKKKIRSAYGEIQTNWIDLDSLILIKQNIDSPRHQEDARVLMEVKKLKAKEGRQ